MSQVAKSASALERAFLAILELEAMEVRLFRRLKLAGVHGDHWTDRLGISIDLRSPAWRVGILPLPLLKSIVINLSGSTSNARAIVTVSGASDCLLRGSHLLLLA
jgi:hypothetical protein